MISQQGPAKTCDDDRVLVVEDSQEDAEAVARALSRTHPHLRLEFVDQGQGLVEGLLAADRVPGLVLLDLNMPGVNGHALLKAIRLRPELARVIVVVFTSSTAPSEVDACYAAGADSYVYKPLNFELFRTVLQGTIDYWQEARTQNPDFRAPGVQAPASAGE